MVGKQRFERVSDCYADGDRSGIAALVVITTEYVDIPAGGTPMRMFVAAPKSPGKYPGIVCYSDIFQLTGTMLRSVARLAGYGFVAVAPEIYHRVEPPGSAIPFDDAGRTRGMEDAAKTPVAHFVNAKFDHLNPPLRSHLSVATIPA